MFVGYITFSSCVLLGGRIEDWIVICKSFTGGHRQSPDPRIISSLTETRIEQREEPFGGGRIRGRRQRLLLFQIPVSGSHN